MYIPKAYQNKDQESVINFIKAFPFGILTCESEKKLMATHLPFVAVQEKGSIVLYAHLAKANKQLNNKDGKEVLAIFSEPNTYVSPSNYEKSDSVPTWNYVAAHLYGKVHVLNEPAQKIDVLKKMISFFEVAYQKQWENLSKEYLGSLLKEIIAFKIVVTETQLQEKLSQDRSKKERKSIMNNTLTSDQDSKKTIGIFMQEKEKQKTSN